MTKPSRKTPVIKRARLMEYSSRREVKMDSAISKVKFVGWINPPKYWEPWVQELCHAHQSTWKDAGIYEAIMNSTYAIKIHDELILELVSRWCSQTNTFVFPWGEATLTLQDMLVLGGFSSLGISALSTLENDVESVKIEEQLELAAKEIRTSTRTKNAPQTQWMKKFTGSGSDLEHAAFLSLWLSRFVYPWGASFGNIINRKVFPIAARLSRGIEVALAPAVLAMLYGELTSLKERLHSTQLVDNLGNKEKSIELCAPFHLVQIWAWERFPTLKPVSDRICSIKEFPRLARWSNVKISNDKDLRSAIDSSKKAFLWCPYSAFAKLEGRDLESFARWTDTSELVGFDCCIEAYQPQRVTRQFRLDGDIPTDNIKRVTNRNTSDYVKLCTTSSASFQPTVAACFEKWRKKKRCSTSSQVKVENMVDSSPPPGFPPRIEVPIVVYSDSDKVENMVDSSPPPGFPPRIEVPVVIYSDSDKDCNATMMEHSRLPTSKTVATCFEKWRKRKICSTSSQVKVKNMVDCDPSRGFPPHIEILVSNSDSDKDCSVVMIERLELPVSKTVSKRVFPSSVALSDSDVVIEVKDTQSMHEIEEPERTSFQQTFPLTSARIREVDENRVPPSGFPPHTEFPSVANSDYDKGCSMTLIENPKTVSKRVFPSSVASSDSDGAIEVKDTRSMHKIEEPERTSIQQTFPFTSARIREVADDNCVPPPGFPPHTEVPSVANSDSNKDCSTTMIENPKAVSKRVMPSSVASSDSDGAIEVKDTRSVHKIEEPERASTQQTFPVMSTQIKEEADENCVPHGFVSRAKRTSVDGTDEDSDGQLQNSNLVSLSFDAESNEAVDIVNGSIHEKGDVVDAKHIEIEGVTDSSTGSLGADSLFLQNELSTSCNAESHMSVRSKDSGLDLEVRINRLENIVYAHIKALEAAR